MHSSADTPTLTFPTPSLRPQQRTPTLAGPAALQPESPRPAAFHAAAANGLSSKAMSQANAPLTGAFPSSPLSLTLPPAHTQPHEVLPSSPVHGVWNRLGHASSAAQDKLSPEQPSSLADRGVNSNLADVAAEMLPETPQLPGRLTGQQAGQMGAASEDVFDHRSLLASAEPQSAALIAVRALPIIELAARSVMPQVLILSCCCTMAWEQINSSQVRKCLTMLTTLNIVMSSPVHQCNVCCAPHVASHMRLWINAIAQMQKG